MKLSIIMDQYNHPHAGTESQVLKLVNGLIAAGWEVRFAVFRGTEYSRSGQFPVAVDQLDVGRMTDPGSWVKVYRYARQLRADGFHLAHIFFNDASVIGPPMLRLAGLRSVISRRDMGFWYTDRYLKVLKWTGRFISAAVCNSRAVAEVTEQAEKLRPELIHVIYNGYPMDTGHDTEAAAAGTPEERPVIGIVANLRPIKRIDDLMRAVALAVENGHDPLLHLVGGGDPSGYQTLAQELGIADRVRFLGSQEHPEHFIRQFDIAVLCSASEGFSNAIIEYLRCGKPVVCTRTGGNPEIISDGVNGFLVEVGDVAGLAEKLQILLADPDMRDAMSRNGTKQVADRYSLDTMIREHVTLYRSLMQGGLQS